MCSSFGVEEKCSNKKVRAMKGDLPI